MIHSLKPNSLMIFLLKYYYTSYFDEFFPQFKVIAQHQQIKINDG